MLDIRRTRDIFHFSPFLISFQFWESSCRAFKFRTQDLSVRKAETFITAEHRGSLNDDFSPRNRESERHTSALFQKNSSPRRNCRKRFETAPPAVHNWGKRKISVYLFSWIISGAKARAVTGDAPPCGITHSWLKDEGKGKSLTNAILSSEARTAWCEDACTARRASSSPSRWWMWPGSQPPLASAPPVSAACFYVPSIFYPAARWCRQMLPSLCLTCALVSSKTFPFERENIYNIPVGTLFTQKRCFKIHT